MALGAHSGDSVVHIHGRDTLALLQGGPVHQHWGGCRLWRLGLELACWGCVACAWTMMKYLPDADYKALTFNVFCMCCTWLDPTSPTLHNLCNKMGSALTAGLTNYTILG